MAVGQYKIEITAAAARAIGGLAENVRIAEAIERLAGNPRPNGCKKLGGRRNLWRIRSGDWRIIYEIRDASLVVVIVKVGNRRDVYK